MIGKLSVALLMISTPVLAQDAAPADASDGAAQEQPAPVAYKTKRVCRSVDVVGSSIPRTTCTTKKIPIKPKDEDSQAGQKGEPQAETGQ